MWNCCSKSVFCLLSFFSESHSQLNGKSTPRCFHCHLDGDSQLRVNGPLALLCAVSVWEACAQQPDRRGRAGP